VNSGRATRERNIEETAYRTNLEAATEIARQVRLRDLAGLVVVDFIDMEDYRHRVGVERRMRDAMKSDRARTQVGRISTFGLLEMSRQRLRPSVVEAHFSRCESCAGTGWVRSMTSSARYVLRGLEQELSKGKFEQLVITLHSKLALEVLNRYRAQLTDIEQRYQTILFFETDDSITPPEYRVERQRSTRGNVPVPNSAWRDDALSPRDSGDDSSDDHDDTAQSSVDAIPPQAGRDNSSRRFRRGGHQSSDDGMVNETGIFAAPKTEEDQEQTGRGRGRGRSRGARGRGRSRNTENALPSADMTQADQPDVNPDAFTETKPWRNAPKKSDQAATVKSEIPAANDAPAKVAPPENITTAPVVTRVTVDGTPDDEHGGNDSGTRKGGWWNKLMKA
jgi:ribonuclease E